MIYPVVVIHGIMGSEFYDYYPLSPELVYSAIMKKEFTRLAFHPDSMKYENIEPAMIRNGMHLSLAYKELIEELRVNLPDTGSSSVPVYSFSYDWRLPLEHLSDKLAEFIEEVIARTALMREYSSDKVFMSLPKVNLIGHSMGGLVIAGYINRMKKNAKVNKVVTLATPFRGSYESVIKLITGTSSLGENNSASREREAARLTPAIYYLFPSFRHFKPEFDIDFSDFNNLQSNLVKSVAAYIQKYSNREGDYSERAEEMLKGLIAQGNQFITDINNMNLDESGLSSKSWLAIAGAGQTTRTELSFRKSGKEIIYNLSSEGRKDNYYIRKYPESMETGDGTVPYQGAEPGFLKKEELVIVTPDDFGYWEIQDKLMAAAGQFHAMIPNMNLVHRLIIRFFKGANDKFNNTWGRSAPGITANQWQPPIKLEIKQKDF